MTPADAFATMSKLCNLVGRRHRWNVSAGDAVRITWGGAEALLFKSDPQDAHSPASITVELRGDSGETRRVGVWHGNVEEQAARIREHLERGFTRDPSMPITAKNGVMHCKCGTSIPACDASCELCEWHPCEQRPGEAA